MSLPQKSEIVKYWYEVWLQGHRENKTQSIPNFVTRFAIDIGEPVCWGCGKFSDSWDYNGWTGKPTVKDRIFRNWDRLPLERCHLVPQSRGGIDHPSNLVLLCSDCHREAPDFVNPEYMIQWLNTRSKNWIQEIIYQWEMLSSTYNISPKLMMRKFIHIVLHHREEFAEFRFKNSVNHFNTYSFATIFTCIKDFDCEIPEE